MEREEAWEEGMREGIQKGRESGIREGEEKALVLAKRIFQLAQAGNCLLYTSRCV